MAQQHQAVVPAAAQRQDARVVVDHLVDEMMDPGAGRERIDRVRRRIQDGGARGDEPEGVCLGQDVHRGVSLVSCRTGDLFK